MSGDLQNLMVTKRAKAQKVKEDMRTKESRVRLTANGPWCKFGISCLASALTRHNKIAADGLRILAASAFYSTC
jgi:hypothetical protein